MAGFAAFGKMPALGDFVRIGAVPAFVTPWDHWVQDSLVSGRQACGDRWLDCYFSAPIWRFSLPPGLAGPGGILGIIMPSVDRVGRQFPLTLFTTTGSATANHRTSGKAFAALENIALDALSDDATRDSLAAALTTVPPAALKPPNQMSDHRSTWSALVEGGTRYVTFGGMPSPRESIGFFDLAADLWPHARTEGSTA